MSGTIINDIAWAILRKLNGETRAYDKTVGAICRQVSFPNASEVIDSARGWAIKEMAKGRGPIPFDFDEWAFRVYSGCISVDTIDYITRHNRHERFLLYQDFRLTAGRTWEQQKLISSAC